MIREGKETSGYKLEGQSSPLCRHEDDASSSVYLVGLGKWIFGGWKSSRLLCVAGQSPQVSPGRGSLAFLHPIDPRDDNISGLLNL